MLHGPGAALPAARAPTAAAGAAPACVTRRAECGVWRGGASLFAKAVLDVHGAVGREVHLVDSFQGLPPPTTDKDELVCEGGAMTTTGAGAS